MKPRELGLPAVLGMSAAIAALGYAIQDRNGVFAPRAIADVAIAWVLCIGAITNVGGAIRSSQVRLVAIATTFYFMWGWLLRYPLDAGLHDHPRAEILPLLLVGGALGTAIFVAPARWSRLALYALLAWHFALGLWLLSLSPDPAIDVFVFQRDAAHALATLHNPYTITFPNIYRDGSVYAPGVVANGRLLFGYPYPPLSLWMVMPGALLGDIRYAQLAAYTLTGAIIATMHDHRSARAAAAVFLCTSRGFFVLEQSWTEPLALLFLAVSVWLALHAPRWLGWCLGLFFASKQYLVVVTVLVPLLADRAPRRTLVLLAQAAAVVAVVTLPLALIDPAAFFHSVIALQWHQPYRPDALSFLNLFTDVKTPLIAFALLVPAAALAWWRAPASPAGFSLAVAFVLVTFFAWNKQAFCNYYFLVIGALCVAVAAVRSPESARPSEIAPVM